MGFRSRISFLNLDYTAPVIDPITPAHRGRLEHWPKQSIWVNPLAIYMAVRTPIILQSLDKDDPREPGNGSGTLISSGDRLFIALAKHVAEAFRKGSEFVTGKFVMGKPVPFTGWKILDLIPHPHCDVALFEVHRDFSEVTAHIPLPASELVSDYNPGTGDKLACLGFPLALRGPVKDEIQDYGFQYIMSKPILRPERRRKRLEALTFQDPFRPDYDAFARLSGKAVTPETGMAVKSLDPLDGMSGGGVWTSPGKPKRFQLSDPSKKRFVGIEVGTLPIYGEKDSRRWMRFVKAKAVLELLGMSSNGHGEGCKCPVCVKPES